MALKMQNKYINILCTRPLEPTLVADAKQQGILIDEISFIDTIPIKTVNVQKQIEKIESQKATIVFTSMNAVEAVADYINHQPDGWDIYCIGTTTNELVKKHFGKQAVIGTANNAAALAQSITKNKAIDKVIFFCGDQRRAELPEILLANNIGITEIMVYQTMAITHSIDKLYDGILFFSPSAVDSFFTNNIIAPSTLIFAIGETTANHIKQFCDNKIIITEVPGKENLIRKMIEYFKQD